jgi:uncharacterized protein
MKSTHRFVPRPYRRPWWLAGPHLQTIGGWLLRRRAGVEYRRERIETPDGDFLDLDHALPEGHPDGPERSAPLVLVLHGLEGGSRALAALQAVRALGGQGLRTATLNFRSCSGEPNRTARMYHAGETEDLGFVLDLLARRFPDAPLGVLGYSLGGNVLLKYLGEQGSSASSRVRAAVAVSVPFDLAAGARRLERGVGRLYSEHFLRSLRRKYAEKRETIGARCDSARVRRSRTLREFDDAATAPLHGFRDVEHYYASSSSRAFLRRVRVPTLLLHSFDDPFLPPEAVPVAEAEENPFLIGCFTRHGGHMGFLAGPHPWAVEYWAEAEAARFLAMQLQAAP